MNNPRYLELYESGELARRVERLESRLISCDICPRDCHIDRLRGETGFCHSAYLPIVSSVCAHHGEEPAISGSKGSGTIFFGNCNMRCIYCQNYQISQDWKAQKVNECEFKTLADRMLYLQNGLGCHNINFVSPTHFVPQIIRALMLAVPRGLKIPLVYNTGGYDSMETIRELDGIIDIYLPDLRYASNSIAEQYSQAPDYVEHARRAIKEMYRQVGNLDIDSSGIARRGLIVRHLILPNGLAGSEVSLTWLAEELSSEVTLSLMAQYSPQHEARDIPELARQITTEEYEAATDLLDKLGIENGWIQEMDSANQYLPDFSRKDQPFNFSMEGGG